MKRQTAARTMPAAAKAMISALAASASGCPAVALGAPDRALEHVEGDHRGEGGRERAEHQAGPGGVAVLGERRGEDDRPDRGEHRDRRDAQRRLLRASIAKTTSASSVTRNQVAEMKP